MSPWPGADRALAQQGSWDWLAFPRTPPLGPALWRFIRPAVFVAIAFLVVGLGAALALRATSTAPLPDDEGIRLLAEAPSPNLNTTSGEAPSLPAPVPPSPATPPVPPPVAPLPEAPRTFEPEPVVVLIPAPPAPETDDIVAVRLSQPGETPMIQEWKMLGMQAVLAGAMFASAGVAADEKKPASSDEKVDVAAQLRELSTQLKNLSNAVYGPENSIKKELERISGDVLEAKGRATKAQGDVDALKVEVDRLRKELDALRSQATLTRVSNYPSPPAGMALVRLENTFAYPVSIIVNSRVYHLNPNETRFSDPVPVGDVSYEVLCTSVPGGVIQGPRTAKITAARPLEINVFTRQ